MDRVTYATSDLSSIRSRDDLFTVKVILTEFVPEKRKLANIFSAPMCKRVSPFIVCIERHVPLIIQEKLMKKRSKRFFLHFIFHIEL